MAKKKINPKKNAAQQQKLKEKSESLLKRELSIDSDSTFDFGGLPERNLKKNLGCG